MAVTKRQGEKGKIAKREVLQGGSSWCLPREKFCRVVLLGAQINAPPDADYVSLIFEVRRVGNNLNQLVRKLNVLGIVHGLELERNQNEIHEVCDMLCDTFRKVVK